MKRLPVTAKGIGLSALVVTLGACGPATLVKSNLPPVLPGGVPPGPTIIHPAPTSYPLSGTIIGLTVQGVEAVDLSTKQRYAAVLDDEQAFRFEHLNPHPHQLEVRTASQRYVLQSLFLVNPERPRFLTIEFKGGPEEAVVDGVPVKVAPLSDD